ncbi:MAG: tRNA (cytidine(34)-2'-O)-methyltransferase [Oligoflexia bacterium]|nr:tRNA (cytidine(34)-2'-O)-methyltransferase [Oligoflexia bacterium]
MIGPKKKQIKIVFYHPEIPGNTGSIGRTCVAMGFRLVLIKPYGFKIDEKSVRRAGLDYWKYVELSEYETFDEFLNTESPNEKDLFFFSRFADKIYFNATFTSNSYLIFGAETTGLEDNITKDWSNRCYKLPTYSDKIRSLNLANTATAVCFEAVRQTKFL